VLRCTSAVVDGEMIVQDAQGRPDFHGLRRAIGRRPCDLVFVSFDLLHLNGRDLRRDPLEERRERLRELVGGAGPGCLQFSEHVVGGGAEFLAAVDQMGLEGIVSKRRRSRYRSGQARAWLKVKCFAEGEFVVIGTAHTAGRAPVALLAREFQGAIVYAGAAMVSLSGGERERFWSEVERLKIDRPSVPVADQAGARWIRPQLRVQARFLKGEEMLRHATVSTVLSAD
jgi:ATP-dependent DNA ligase